MLLIIVLFLSEILGIIKEGIYSYLQRMNCVAEINANGKVNSYSIIFDNGDLGYSRITLEKLQPFDLARLPDIQCKI